MKSVVGLILGIVGAIGNLCLAIFFGIFTLIVYLGRGALVENNLSSTLINFAGKLGFWLIIICVWYLVLGIFSVIFSSMMNKNVSVKKGGIGCLITGILTINLFLFIGGIMGIIASFKTKKDAILIDNY